MMHWTPNPNRYEKMIYRRCGKSGLKLPAISLGMWHNFGEDYPHQTKREICRKAFDLGITHFDIANNYGPPPGSAEIAFGQLLKTEFAGYRDELVISTKAGYNMWPGPYGEWGSRKYLIASCDQSLKRMGLDYVDIFYSHRFDPNTPLEETMGALDYIVRSGRALYVGISSYDAEQTQNAIAILKSLGTPLLVHQPRYNMLDRWIEDGLTEVLRQERVGAVVFSPLAQGLLTNKYLNGVPADSRAARTEQIYFNEQDISAPMLTKVKALHEIAVSRGQTLAQMALVWVLNNEVVTSALIGASRPEQIKDSVAALDNREFSEQELARIDAILK